MLFAMEQSPFHIDAGKIPADFVKEFEQRRCSQLSCEACGYCETIAAEAVTVDRAFREEQLVQLREARQALIDGRLWGV